MPKPKTKLVAPKPSQSPKPPPDRKLTTRRNIALSSGSEKELADWLLVTIKEEGGKHEPLYDEGDVYEYSPYRGIWAPVPYHEMSQIVQSFDASTLIQGKQVKPLKVSSQCVRGTIQLAVDRIHNLEFFGDGKPGLAFRNGFLPVREEGTGALQPHSPENRARFAYPFDFNPKAEAPQFLEFLQDMFRDDDDKDEKIRCLQEFFGASLAGLAPTYQKCLFLRSPGGGGRSTLLEIIDAAMPVGSICNVDPHQFDDDTRRHMLAGKLLNYSDECPSAAMLESNWFKKIITGNWTDGKRLYKDPIRFRPIAGHVWLANELPTTGDLTDAFFRRVIVMAFNRKFHEEEGQDRHIAPRIIAEEIPGIVTWLIRGLSRLVRQREFTMPQSHMNELRMWRLKSDTVALFVSEWTALALSKKPTDKNHDWLSGKKLYESYGLWAAETGHKKPVAQNVFGTRLKGLGIPSKHTERGMFYQLRMRRHGLVGMVDPLEALEKRPRLVLDDAENHPGTDDLV